jgi:cytoskeletal protein CcmA (bactofilin family)
MNLSDFRDLNFSFIGRNNKFKGEFFFEGDTIINCSLEGEITSSQNSKITFDRESIFDGTLTAHDVEIFGKVSGNIQSSGALIIRASAEVSGKIQAASLKIYPGATVNMEGDTTLDSSQETLKS